MERATSRLGVKEREGKRGWKRRGKVWRANVRIAKFTDIERTPVKGERMGGRWREESSEKEEAEEVGMEEEVWEGGGRRQSIIVYPEMRLTKKANTNTDIERVERCPRFPSRGLVRDGKESMVHPTVLPTIKPMSSMAAIGLRRGIGVE